LPKLNRKEIEKMFSLSDLRETKVYQEALIAQFTDLSPDAIEELQRQQHN